LLHDSWQGLQDYCFARDHANHSTDAIPDAATHTTTYAATYSSADQTQTHA